MKKIILLTLVSVWESVGCCSDEPCISLCCPHDHARLDSDEEHIVHRCDETSSLPSLQTCQPRNTSAALTKFTSRWSLENINFVGDEEFKCSTIVSAKAKLTKFNITLEDGQVKISYKDRNNQTLIWPLQDACLNFYESRKTGKVKPSLYVCDSRPDVSPVKYVYPVMILLSSLLMFLTLIVYILLKDLREPLIGKMVVGFLVNVTLNFLANGISRSLQFIEYDFLNTSPCIFLAYFTHYTFISFFMWMNAMAINMTRKFKNMMENSSGRATNKKLFLIVLYTQGLPALLSIIIAILDNHGDCSKDKDDLILPNIARHNCFLKTQYYKNDLKDIPEHKHFWIKLRSAEFLYYYMIVLIIVLVNIVCFLITGYHLRRHFKDTQPATAKKTVKEQTKMALFISTIMGVTWLLDVISFLVDTADIPEIASDVIQLILDVANLLTGPLIFFNLVCKKSTLEKLKRRVGLDSQPSSSSQQLTKSTSGSKSTVESTAL